MHKWIPLLVFVLKVRWRKRNMVLKVLWYMPTSSLHDAVDFMYHPLGNCGKINVGFPICDLMKVHHGVVIWKVSQSFSAAVLPPPLLSFPLLCLFLLMCHHSQEIPHVLNGSKTFLLHEPVPFPLCLFLLIFLLLFFFTQVGLPTSFSFTQQSPSNICSFLHFFKTFPSTCLSLRAKSADSPSLKI